MTSGRKSLWAAKPTPDVIERRSYRRRKLVGAEPLPAWARWAIIAAPVAITIYALWPILSALWGAARAAYGLGSSVAQ